MTFAIAELQFEYKKNEIWYKTEQLRGHEYWNVMPVFAIGGIETLVDSIYLSLQRK